MIVIRAYLTLKLSGPSNSTGTAGLNFKIQGLKEDDMLFLEENKFRLLKKSALSRKDCYHFLYLLCVSIMCLSLEIHPGTHNLLELAVVPFNPAVQVVLF